MSNDNKPVGGVRFVRKLPAGTSHMRLLPSPHLLSSSDPIPAPVQTEPAIDPYAAILGTTATDQKVRVPDEVRQSGMYILGIQGRGKSSLLEQIIYQDICKGSAVLVLDPHGDLIDHCIAHMPAERLKDAYLLDMEDESYPFGVNLFTAKKHATAIARTQAVDRVMHVFEAVWGDVLKQQNLPRYLRAAILTLLQNPGTTLVDMYPFLLQEEYRHKLLRSVKDPGVKEFWQYQYDDLTTAARKRETASLVNRLEGLFMGRNLISNILGQSATTIDFRAAIENKEIIFIKLPIQTIPQDAALIGTMLIAQIHATIFSFKDLPLNKRPTYSIFIDEFQNFVTKDIEEIYTGGRKFGSRLCIAHQFAKQIPDYLVSAVTTANTKVIFQPSPEDATSTRITTMFAGMERQQTNIDINVFSGMKDHPNPAVKEFYLHFVSKLEDVWLKRNRPFGTKEVTDKIQHFLYYAQKNREIDQEAQKKLIKDYGELFKLTEKPEQLQNFARTLTQVTQVLINQPIAQEQPTYSQADIGQLLQRLERRHAYVKTGAEIYAMRTLDTPRPAPYSEQIKRIAQIREQTRAKYCRPAQEVEREIRQRLNGSEEAAEPELPNDWTTGDEPEETWEPPDTGHTKKKEPKEWNPFEDEDDN